VTSRTWRVAAAQFATGTDRADNLSTALRMIDQAAGEMGAVDHPRLVVLPEFCNHLSVYESAEHCFEVAIDLDPQADDGWVSAVSEAARRRAMWVQVNCTVRRPTTDEPLRTTNTNLLFDPSGALVAASDKTVLMGAEGIFLSPARAESTLVTAADGTCIGHYACMDGVVPEVPRSVAVRGAQLMLNSLNSFALDEAELHIPVRAAENRVWVVACCKVGALLPADKVAEFSAAMGVPGDMLCGAGESQIVAPDGSVVARAPRVGEAVVWADIDLSTAGMPRPDGTDVRAARRPELYGPLAEATPTLDDHPRAAHVAVAAVRRLDDVADALATGAELVVLPELAGGAGPADIGDPVDADRLASHPTIAALIEALVDSTAVAVTSCRIADAHVGVIVGADGVIATQAQLHRVARYPWAVRHGISLVTVDMAWGRLAVVVGDDIVYPELARLAALQSVDVLAVPFSGQEPWETGFGIVERAAENRLCVVAANAAPGGDSLIVSLPPDFTLWAPSRERTFDGTINRPDVTRGVFGEGASVVRGVIHPARTVNRQISRNTNLVDGRPWQLCGPLTR
jgi:deaminated glutathione amidase